MKTISINNIKYEIIKDEGDCINAEELAEKITDYFDAYDYIFGDYAYEKVRLKGYNDSSNKKANKINNFDNLEEYLKDNCAVDCRYFILKRSK